MARFGDLSVTAVLAAVSLTTLSGAWVDVGTGLGGPWEKSAFGKPWAPTLPLAAKLAPLDAEALTCALPPVSVEVSRGCLAGADSYPACRWSLPLPRSAAGGFRLWRNTEPEHLSGRPELVSLVLITAAAYSERFPGEALVVGDLDAPGPRHHTHASGQDVDLYLPGIMWTENEGGGLISDNYAGLSTEERRRRQERVLDLAKILATCSRGKLRIYYNDPWVVRAFNRWFAETSLTSPYGNAMQMHNALHRFHFHVTLAPS